MMGRYAVSCVAAVIILTAALGAVTCQAQEAKTFPVSGKVLMPDGSPASGAVVEARSTGLRRDWRVDATATTGSDGAFTMQLKMGDYRFYAVSGQLVHLQEWGSMVEVKADGSLSKPIGLKLEKGCKVEGTVVDKSTGQPVGGVKIVTREGDHAESSDSGAWSMVVVKHSSHALAAVKEGYYWPIVNFNGSGDTAKVKVEIKPGGTIKGRAINEQGKPVAGIWIGTESSGYFSLFGSRADPDGRFTLSGLDPDSTARIWVSAKGYDDLREQPVTFPAGKREVEAELKLTTLKLRAISGRVTRPDGSPVEGAEVAYGHGPNYWDYVTTKTDKDGGYAIKNARLGKALVVASGKGLAPLLKQAEADKDLRIDFQMKPGHTVEGRVEDQDGKPLTGARLSVSMEAKGCGVRDDLYSSIGNTETDKDGRFKLENLPEGSVYADVYSQGFDSLDNERLKVDRKDYTLVLRKAVLGQVSGTVVKDSDGTPVTEFNVRLDFSRNGGMSSGLSPGLVEQGVNFQPSDGKFNIKGLKVKEGFRVVVTAPGYLQASVDPVTVKPLSEDAYKQTVIRLRPANSFEGSVTEAGTGSPVDGAMVTVWDTGSFGSNTSFRWDMSGTSLKSVTTRTGADGKFRFESMPFSSGAIMLEKQGLARTLVRGVRLSRPMQASMEKSATVTGSIADEQGKPPTGAWLNLRQIALNLEFNRTEINPDGSFKLVNLPPGEYLVMQYKDNRGTKHQSFRLKAGEAYQVDWVQRGAVTVEGKVLQNGKPMPSVEISANSNKKGMNWAGSAKTEADGSYKLTLMDPGTYFFSCIIGEWMDPNHIRSAKTLKLAAGTNRVDFNMPCGSISGKLVDKLTGQPLAGTSVRFYMRETYAQHMGRKSLYFSAATPTWWPQNECKTDKNGLFQAKNLKAGKWMVCMAPGARGHGIPAGIVNLAEGEAKTGVVAKVPPTGSAQISVPGVKGMPKLALIACVDEYGMTYYPEYKDRAYTTEYTDLPVGKMRAVVESNAYLPIEIPFQVRRDETANVSVKLTKGPRIIFKPKADSGDSAGVVSVAFRITTPDGKPVLRGVGGPKWGEVIGRGLPPGEPAAITIGPGTYVVRAAAVQGADSSWGSEPDLSRWSARVKVVAGKDTVVEIPWDQ